MRELVVARRWGGRVVWAIKLLHTAIFAVMSCFVLYTTYSGLRNRITRLTVISWLAVLGECLVLLLNQNRCPLTDVVEDLGAEHGSVSDIFLPDWAARRIPQLMWFVVAGGVALIWQRWPAQVPSRYRFILPQRTQRRHADVDSGVEGPSSTSSEKSRVVASRVP